MPISNKTISLMAKSLKIDEATVKAALENEKEVELEIPEVQVFKSEELETFKKNIDDTAFKRGVDHKSKNAEEMFIKNIRQQEDLTLTENTTDGLINALKGKYSGDKKELVQKFEEEKQGLVNNFNTKLADTESLAKQYQEQLRNKDLQFNLYNSSPDGLTIKKEHASKLFLSDVKWEKDASDRDVIVLNGVKQVDNTMNPIPMDKVYNDWIVKNEYIKTASGRGLGDEGGQGSGGNALANFNKSMTEQNIGIGSATYNQKLQEKASTDPAFKEEVLASE